MGRRLQVVDYGGGNTGSVLRCLDRLGLPYERCGGAGQAAPSGDQPLLLPGVGAFGAVMAALEARGLVDRLRDAARGGTPLLGICVGLQVLFAESDESPGVPGLGLLPGRVVRFPPEAGKVPQVGWNRLRPGPAASAALGADEGYVYFVNSYHARPEDPSQVLYEADYGGPFCAAVRSGSLCAFQFHPERSGTFGHSLVQRFWELVR